MRLGLEMMRTLDDLFGNPSRACPVIHVGGTNGKGSVTTKMAAVLQENGYKVGLYTSPHISTFRERIRVNGEMISEEEALVFLQNLPKNASFFECMTLLAFHHFAKEKCDVVVLEVGMGGRLDATNIVTPILSVITSIGFDHSLYLGDTLEKIAFEKAGIIKPGVPALLGPSAAIYPIFRQKTALYHEVLGKFENFEEENRAIAAKALDLLPFKTDLKAGIEKLPPCRFEIFNEKVILDVAHNPEGLEAVFKRLGKKVRVVFAMGQDKEINPFLDVLIKNATFLHVTEAKNPRACLATELASRLKRKGFDRFTIHNEPKEAFQEAKKHDDELLVTGTFYIMSEIRQELGVVEPCDPLLVTPY